MEDRQSLDEHIRGVSGHSFQEGEGHGACTRRIGTKDVEKTGEEKPCPSSPWGGNVKGGLSLRDIDADLLAYIYENCAGCILRDKVRELLLISLSLDTHNENCMHLPRPFL